MRQGVGSLLIVERANGPVYFGKWRDSSGRQVKRRLGPAWVERNGSGWARRRGRVPEGVLDERAAFVALAAEVDAHKEKLAELPDPSAEATFADAAEKWLHHLEHVKGCKPSTVGDYRYMLAPVGTPSRKRGKPPAARIMKRFGHRPLASVTSSEIHDRGLRPTRAPALHQARAPSPVPPSRPQRHDRGDARRQARPHQWLAIDVSGLDISRERHGQRSPNSRIAFAYRVESRLQARTRVSYRNKTYVAFASEDIRYYRMMEAWRENKKIDFSFFDAHDLYVSRDTSRPETIKRNLRERMKNAKQIVLLGSTTAKAKGGDGRSFLAHEVSLAIEFHLPIVVANLDGDRDVDRNFIPKPLLDADYYTLSVSFQAAIIRFALDNYAPTFATSKKSGPHYYEPQIYRGLDL